MNPNQRDPKQNTGIIVSSHDYAKIAVDQTIQFAKAISKVKALSIEDFEKVLTIINKQYGREELR